MTERIEDAESESVRPIAIERLFDAPTRDFGQFIFFPENDEGEQDYLERTISEAVRWDSGKGITFIQDPEYPAWDLTIKRQEVTIFHRIWEDISGRLKTVYVQFP